MRIVPIALVVFAVSTVSLSARAQEQERAEDKTCVEAADRGQSLQNQGKLLDARDQFAVCADPQCPSPIPTDCGQWLAETKQRIPTVVFRATDASGHDVTDATVLIDDAMFAGAHGRPMEIDPGTHQLVITRGTARHEQTLVIAEGEKNRLVMVRLESPNDSRPEVGSATREIPTASWIGWGVGAAGLIGFTAFGLAAKATYDDHQSTCGNRCTLDDRDEVKSFMVFADISLAVAVVGAIAGTAMYFIAKPSSPAASVGAR